MALACALADAGISSLLVERSPRAPIEGPAEDGRDIVWVHRARRVMESPGLWHRLPADVPLLLRDARVADDDARTAARHFGTKGTGLDELGWRVVGQVAHENDSRGIGWECCRCGHTLALLPLNGCLRSAVVTIDSSSPTPRWFALGDDELAARAQARSPAMLGAVKAAGPRHHYPLVGVCAHRCHAHRFALIGDSAVGMHPSRRTITALACTAWRCWCAS